MSDLKTKEQAPQAAPTGEAKTKGLDLANLEIQKVSEIVGEKSEKSFGKKISKKKDNSGGIFRGISDKIYGILGSKTAKEVILPSISLQKKRVAKSLHKERSKLISKAHKIKNARHFKASLLEETVQQIRYIQSLIDSLFNLANKKITELYKKYYLNIG